MTIRARLCGGTMLNGIVAHAGVIYDGVSIELKGFVRDEYGKSSHAGCSIEMNPKEALDLARELIKAAEKHGHQTMQQSTAMRKRMVKRTPS